MKEGQSPQNAGGMSRAAKKRAKKNKKKNNLVLAAQERLQPEKKKAKLEDESHVDDASELKSVKDAKQSIDSEMSDNEEKKDKTENSSDEATDAVPSDAFPGIEKLSLEEILLRKDPHDEETKKMLEGMTSEQRASALFQAIIHPIPLSTFYKEYWEKKPLLSRAKDRKRYKGLLSLESIKETTKKEALYYNRDLNLTKYTIDDAGVKRRLTLDKTPQNEKEEETGVLVNAKELWKRYGNGCTIRLLCPHKHADNVQALLSFLELELQCMVGANAYLTPPKASQGFAPHYDDIEAFCLQLQGKKRWKVYEPTLKLPRASSEDYSVEEMKNMAQVMDITLEEGDLLYMPRGWIHQACTLKDADQHSLHLTVSAMQQWAWVDLLDMVIPEALEAAAMSETSSSLRQGLPRGFLDYMGAMYEEPSDEKLPDSLKKAGEEDELVKFRKLLQENFRAEAKKRIMKVAKAATEMVDAACDQLAKRFMSERQPPSLTPQELLGTVKAPDGEDKQILPNTMCRLARPGIARIVVEDDKAVLYHCLDNSREFEGNPLSPMEFEMDDGPALEQLLTTVEPHWILVNDLYHDSIEDKVAIAQALYDEGILSIHESN